MFRRARLVFPLVAALGVGCGTYDTQVASQSHGLDEIPPIETLVWEKVSPPDSPRPRLGAAAAYDEARRNVVLFGGSVDPRFRTGRTNETWLWDGITWVKADVPEASRPPTRMGHAMVYDAARKQVVLFGGSDKETDFLGDTWLWDGTTWKDVTPATSPPARASHAMAYDPVRQRVVLHGGLGTYEKLADTWEWDGTRWAEVTPPNPGPGHRAEHHMYFDTVRGRIVLYGGDPEVITVADMWEWDGTRWSRVTPKSFVPDARIGGVFVYDTHRRRSVLTTGLVFRGRWYDPGTTRVWEREYWNDEVQVIGEPSRRTGAAAAYDANNGRLVLFGGLDDANFDTLLGDTWVLHGYGGRCKSDDQCNDGHCVYGVCCTTACDDGCSVCSVARGATTDGICTPLTSPCENDSPGDGADDGTGSGLGADDPLLHPLNQSTVRGCSASLGTTGNIAGALVVGLGALVAVLRRRR